MMYPEILFTAAILSALLGWRLALAFAERKEMSGWRRGTLVTLGLFLPMQAVLLFIFIPVSWEGLSLWAMTLPVVWLGTALCLAGMAYIMESMGGWLGKEP